MTRYGFSTGALALGDFRGALGLLVGTPARAVELSALRDHEVRGLVEAIPTLELAGYDYVSVHAPSRFQTVTEADTAELLSVCIPRRGPVIVHPDTIQDYGCWRDLADLLCIENMDKRKTSGRTVAELEEHFRKLPSASLCLDLGHARQVDPTMGVVREIIDAFGERLTQIHLSELDTRCRHQPLSVATVAAVREIRHLIPKTTVILESQVPAAEIENELRMARSCFSSASPPIASRYQAMDELSG